MNHNPGTAFALEVRPRIPERIARLEELANNLWYSWHRPTRTLFARLNPAVWEAAGYNPKAFLKSVHERQLQAAAEDPAFLHDYNQTLAAYDAYHNQPEGDGRDGLGEDDLVAYFCAEFGFHESLPIYSGGLGILAGDHCKTASDMGLPFVAVGLLYRQGYFQQSIDAEGNQHAVYNDSDFSDLPISPVVMPDGEELEVTVEFGDRDVEVKVWQAKVGRVTLYLLDTDLPANRPEERATAHRLYGGDRDTRIKQEIVLGIGGVRALEAMKIKPTVWHINEGHAAFLIVERTRGLILQGLEPAAAFEAVAANTIFTTHTAVAAGHDHFSEEMVVGYFQRYARELNLSLELMLGQGRTGAQQATFNMTALAARGSRFQNGVSKIHGDVSSRLLAELWPQIPPEESPIGSVTNGVHVESFLAPGWADHFDRFVSGWNRRLDEPQWLAGIMDMPDHMYWSVRQQLKSRMFSSVRKRISEQHFRNKGSESHLDRVLKLADPANPHVLTIGFGRRFATYKRATLLFENIEWLKQIVSDPERPVLFLFSGKAHPADQPGKDMIRRVIEIAALPEFEGKILFVEGYDLRLARRLVSGVDVWLNNPVYPMEASGTSGMKAAFNGAINLSVLDGWWDEGYRGDNGWAVKPASDHLDDQRRAHEESRALYELLQDRVIPLYYQRGQLGYSPEWIRLSKRSMMSLMPQFNSHRMVGDYLRRFYVPAANQGKRIRQDDYAAARDLAGWKARVRNSWDAVRLRALDAPTGRMYFGETAKFAVAAAIDGLDPRDIVVELIITPTGDFGEEAPPRQNHVLVADGQLDGGEHRFAVDFAPELSGKLEYRLRAYPYHPALTHRFEMGLMKWL